jgi:hypothetical protein
MMAKLTKKRWVVYAKRPFGRPAHVLAYLGRYTHRVGISNRRILSCDGNTVTIATKNGATATVTGVEFLRRFVQHVLPKRFVKIRQFRPSVCHRGRRRRTRACRGSPGSLGPDLQVMELELQVQG